MNDMLSHSIVIIGGGDAGISVASRLRHAGESDVAVIEPNDTHAYQPLWTLVGGGAAPLAESRRPEADVMPQGAAWIKTRAVAVDPHAHTVALEEGTTVRYETLIVAAGLQLDLDAVEGMRSALDSPLVSSNYIGDLAPKTWELVRGMRSGTAVFTMPSKPIKCGGAPQKIAYLACDYWREQGVLDRIRVVLVLPNESMFQVPEFSRELEKVATDYGIGVRLASEMTSIAAESQTMTIVRLGDGSSERLHYDMAHVVPPQSAPDWVKSSPLADPASPGGYIEVDQHTLQHPRHPDVFALGDVASLPTSKTGAAIRKQAPVVVANVLAHRAGDVPSARYNGYSSCPLTTSRSRMLLAEFDYSGRPAPSIPFIDTTKPRRDMWLLKRYGLPALYWRAILPGRM